MALVRNCTSTSHLRKKREKYIFINTTDSFQKPLRNSSKSFFSAISSELDFKVKTYFKIKLVFFQEFGVTASMSHWWDPQKAH